MTYEELKHIHADQRMKVQSKTRTQTARFMRWADSATHGKMLVVEKYSNFAQRWNKKPARIRVEDVVELY